MDKRYPSGILASCVIPWREDYTVDEELFRREIALTVAQTPLVYVMGTAGEGYAVSDRQFEQVVRVFAEETRRAGVDPMVGVISLSYPTIRERIEWARGIGVHSFQISLPSWGTCTPEETRRFFRGICGEFQDCTFLHYNIPRSGRVIEADEYAGIMHDTPNLVATKNGNPSVVFLSRLLEAAPELQHFITDMGFAFAAFVGECGLLRAMASCNWDSAKEYYRRAREREYAGALEMQQELIRLNADLRRIVSPHGHIDPAFDKMYVKVYLRDFPLRLMPPYSGVPDTAFEQLLELLQTRYPRWYSPAR